MQDSKGEGREIISRYAMVPAPLDAESTALCAEFGNLQKRAWRIAGCAGIGQIRMS